jgi:hypothetical protein
VSKCRYVGASATIAVMGPRELANLYAVDEVTIMRARQRIVAKRVQQAAQLITIDDPKDFDSKMTILREIRPDQIPAIESLTDQLRANWRMALAFDRELDETVPSLHRAPEQNRKRILTKVSQLMLASTEPWSELMNASTIAQEILDKDFGNLYGSLVQDVSSGEVARLVGECPIGWQKPKVANG